MACSGRLCAGLVQAIHKALIWPSAAASNISSADLPGSAGTASTPHSWATSARCCGLAMSRWALSRLDRPPTSRPPIALGWPVKDKGPAPGLPIWPVARCRLISAALLAVPLLLWFSPWQYRLSVGRRSLWLPGASAPPQASHWAARYRSASARPQTWATRSGVASRTTACSCAKPLVCASTKAGSAQPWASMMCKRPWQSITSVPGCRARCRSASSAVSVRRGSTTMILRSGWRALASSTRRNRIGCAQAILLPLMNRQPARSMSS